MLTVEGLGFRVLGFWGFGVLGFRVFRVLGLRGFSFEASLVIHQVMKNHKENHVETGLRKSYPAMFWELTLGFGCFGLCVSG